MKTLILKIFIPNLRWDFFRGSGKGGQKRNKTDNCARCTHEESTASGKSEESRLKEQNKSNALKKMIESSKFKDWVDWKLQENLGKKHVFGIVIEDKYICIYDHGEFVEPKRKEVVRKPVMKNQAHTEKRKIKKLLKKFIDS